MADFPVPRLESCLVVANPRAGSVTRELIDDVAERCARHAEVRLAWTAGPGDATAIAAQEAAVARSSGVRVVVAVGGDGTVLEVVEGLVGDGRAPDGVALLVVPGGTGNSDYRSHWGERPWQQALEQALGDGTVTPRRLDLARVRESGELIVLGAGVGLTAEVLRSARGIELRGKDRLRAGLDHAATHYTPSRAVSPSTGSWSTREKRSWPMSEAAVTGLGSSSSCRTPSWTTDCSTSA